jgi:hypothetical protein
MAERPGKVQRKKGNRTLELQDKTAQPYYTFTPTGIFFNFFYVSPAHLASFLRRNNPIPNEFSTTTIVSFSMTCIRHI